MIIDENASLLDAPRPSIDVESLEASQKQRRASMQMRRASLAEVIPDWPTLNRAPKVEQVLIDDVIVSCWHAAALALVPGHRCTCPVTF